MFSITCYYYFSPFVPVGCHAKTPPPLPTFNAHTPCNSNSMKIILLHHHHRRCVAVVLQHVRNVRIVRQQWSVIPSGVYGSRRRHHTIATATTTFTIRNKQQQQQKLIWLLTFIHSIACYSVRRHRRRWHRRRRHCRRSRFSILSTGGWVRVWAVRMHWARVVLFSFFMIMTKACLVYLMRLFDFIAAYKFWQAKLATVFRFRFRCFCTLTSVYVFILVEMWPETNANGRTRTHNTLEQNGFLPRRSTMRIHPSLMCAGSKI